MLRSSETVEQVPFICENDPRLSFNIPIKEIDEALKTASKRGTGKVGFPEYVGVVKDFLLVIEDKASLQNHIKRNDDKLISLETYYYLKKR